MSKLQFSVLSGTSLLASLLFLFQIYLGEQAQSTGRQLMAAQQSVAQGQQAYAIYRQLAARTYQASQQEPILRGVLARQNITVTPSGDAPESRPATVKNP